jgi:hypothetical protein
LQYEPNEVSLKKIIFDNGCSYEEATRLDYEKNWKEKCNLFDNQTRNILSLFTKFFTKYKTSDSRIVVLHFVKKVTDSRLLCCDGICEFQVQYDYDGFFKLSEYDKKRETLKLLKMGLDSIIEEKKWDRSVFDEAYNKVIEVEYVNEWYWKKAIKSPTKDYNAIVFCEHKVDSFDISIIIKNNKGEEIKKKEVLSLIPHELVFNNYLGELKWISDNAVSLINEFGTKQWSVKVN